jgi:hypothetical protein
MKSNLAALTVLLIGCSHEEEINVNPFGEFSRVYEYNCVEPNGASETAILQFETHVGLRLPIAFRRYIGAFDGANFAWTRVDMSDVEDGEAVPAPRNVWLNCLFRLGQSSAVSTSLWYEDDERVLGEVGSRDLWVGLTIDGSRIYITVEGELADHVWLATGEDWFLLAESVDEFFRNLQLEPGREGGAGSQK